jgi:hypothetical protein
MGRSAEVGHANTLETMKNLMPPLDTTVPELPPCILRSRLVDSHFAYGGPGGLPKPGYLSEGRVTGVG